MTIAETCMSDMAPPLPRQLHQRHQQQQLQRQPQRDGMHGGNGGGGGGSGSGAMSAPPRIRKATRMTRRIQNAYGDAAADGRISCLHCSQRIALGSPIRRVKRTGRCWHDDCYRHAGRGGLVPPKMRSIRRMTRRIKKVHGCGDDHSVLCQMCGREIAIGMEMRRATGTGMCWHEQCYQLAHGGGAARPRTRPRPAYALSNAKWKRMLSECMECAGSLLCDKHRRIEAELRVPLNQGAVDGAAP